MRKITREAVDRIISTIEWEMRRLEDAKEAIEFLEELKTRVQNITVKTDYYE